MIEIPSDLISITIVFLISVLIGLTIVKIVETRMSDISIKMPTINLPEHSITIQMSPGDAGAMTGTAESSKVTYDPPMDAKPKPLQDIQQGGASDMICPKDLPPVRTSYNPNNYHSLSGSVKKHTTEVPPPSSKRNQVGYPAPYPRTNLALTEPNPQPSGTTYYMDPKKMTPEQLVKFQQRAKFTNMTVKDYENWLWTYREDPGRLNGFHRANLKVIVRGGNLKPTDMPSRHKIPDSGADQYTQIMQGADWEKVSHPEFAGYEPHNFDEFIGQPRVKPNRNLRHLDYVNPDEPMKTWILTRPHKKMNSAR